MGFADAYLQKHAIGEPLIGSAPDPELHSIIALPAYNESGLTRCLDSLFSCTLPDAPAEVIVLINSGEHTPQEIIALNRRAHTEVVGWSASRQRPQLTFHTVLLENLPKKHFGAGLARKLVMDEAVRRFNQVEHAEGIILSLDGDTLVEQNYLREVTGLFDRTPSADGCAIRFAHPLNPSEEQVAHVEREDHPAAIYNAIVNYELHQRYYLEAVRYTGYPYAFHTVGSAFAVRASAYCRQGGMSKRQAGEDFYFIQKVAMQGNFSECNTTTVHPSPRPSDRVPFGTGPAVARQLAEPGVPYLTYAPELFSHLQTFYALIPDFFACDASCAQQHTGPEFRAAFNNFPGLLQRYLEETGFWQELTEIHRNVASEAAFRQRFFRKFNMFRILKYLHFAGEQGVDKVEVGAAAREMLEMKGEQPNRNGTRSSAQRATRELLEIFRRLSEE